MNAEYPPAHPGSGPWWQSPRGWGQGRGASPSLTRGGLRGKFSCNAPLRGRLHHFLPPEVRDLRAGITPGERRTSTRTAPEKRSIPESRRAGKIRMYSGGALQRRYAFRSLDLGLSSSEPHLRQRVARTAFRALHFIQTFTLSRRASASGNLAISKTPLVR
jgi:hypothetical protein